MKILTVGASGFLGKQIARAALSKGWIVSGTYYKKPDLIPDSCEKVRIDSLDQLDDDFDLVYIAVGNFTLSSKELIYVNRDIPIQISKKFKSSKIIFISSISVYGSHKDIITPSSSFNNPTPYGLSKLMGESVVSKHKKFAVIRFTNLYGIGMNERSFMPKIIKDAITKRVIVLTNKGERKHDYLHIDDAADLCIKAGIDGENEIYLGATGNSVSNLEIAKIIQKIIPDCKIIFSGEDSAFSFSFDPNATMKKISWYPQKKLEEGIKEVVNNYENISI